MNKINAAVVGAGIYGKHHINAYHYNPWVNLVGFCEINPDIRANVAAEFQVPGYASLEELFAATDVDLVSIATPDPFHFDATIEAISAGKHVLIEKPMATTSAECREIIRCAQQQGVKIGVDYHKRWDGMAQHIHHELLKPETGQVLRGYMSMDDIIDVPKNWLSWANESSPVHFLGTHCFDLIRYYMNGANAVSVYAIGQKKKLVAEGIDSWDTIQSFVTFDNGAQWTVEVGGVYHLHSPKQMMVAVLLLPRITIIVPTHSCGDMKCSPLSAVQRQIIILLITLIIKPVAMGFSQYMILLNTYYLIPLIWQPQMMGCRRR